jgi:hypothetical protein
LICEERNFVFIRFRGKRENERAFYVWEKKSSCVKNGGEVERRKKEMVRWAVPL